MPCLPGASLFGTVLPFSRDTVADGDLEALLTKMSFILTTG